MKKNLEDINRATEEGYVRYMIANPCYFEQLFKLSTTVDNVKAMFRKLKNERLVAAAFVRIEKGTLRTGRD